ncbi:MAG: cytochrome c biogenesis protein CcdA [Helicobacteraceae bacterium]|nr:cytochrome c biogenesis protein CcdA [Helicobacteraceae bacterium]
MADLELSLREIFDAAPFIVSFLAGILSFLLPCHLSLVPSYMSYISGLTIAELKKGELGAAKRARVIGAALMFIAGFSAIFISIGVLSDVTLGGERFGYWIGRPSVIIASGAIIVMFALHFVHLINLPFLNFDTHLNLQTKIALFAPFVLGVSFAIGSTPCTGPVLGAIVTMSFQEGAKAHATLLMTAFSMGVGAPFILLAIATVWSMKLLQKIKRRFRAIEIAGGVLLAAIGVFYIYNGISRLLMV